VDERVIAPNEKEETFTAPTSSASVRGYAALSNPTRPSSRSS